MVRRSGSRVVIFSRSGEDEYRWLLDILGKDCLVSPFIITNSNHSLFYKEVYSCSFGILYHSRNRGRVNITDVTDSLYDVEVKTMSEVLGKGNLITFIDDLDDSSETEKQRILKHQPSLKTLTDDIVLFTREDKANDEQLRRRVKNIIIKYNLGTSRPPGSFTPVSIPAQGPGKTSPRSQGHLRKLLISALSSFVLWKWYSESPVLENIAPNASLWKLQKPYFTQLSEHALLLLWAPVIVRVFCIHHSKPVIPLIDLGRITVFGAITFFMVSGTYHRPSALNVVGSGLCITSWIRYLQPRSQQHSNELIWRVIPYGLVLLAFWEGWQQTDVETTLQKISQFVLRSPGILAAVGI